MASPADYRAKVQQLQTELSKATVSSSVGNPESCMSTSMIIAAVTPIVIFLALFFISPKFVQKKNGSKMIRDTKKVFIWKSGVTIAIWAGIYGYTSYFGDNAVVCAK